MNKEVSVSIKNMSLSLYIFITK